MDIFFKITKQNQTSLHKTSHPLPEADQTLYQDLLTSGFEVQLVKFFPEQYEKLITNGATEYENSTMNRVLADPKRKKRFNKKLDEFEKSEKQKTLADLL